MSSDTEKLHEFEEEESDEEKVSISEYEKIRLRNIEESRKMLIKLGLIQPIQEPISKEQTVMKHKGKRMYKSNVNADSPPKRRLSQRLRGIKADDTCLAGGVGSPDLNQIKRENVYGPITGINVGHCWRTRLECSIDGIHRPPIAGIHPGPEGAYSIALTGGYEDDVDFGKSFTFTGTGGRDLKKAKAKPNNLRISPQNKDQTLNYMNCALKKSVETGKPVRVIRGFKLPSKFAPEEGYRYDGIYYVRNWWLSPGKSGFRTFKFALQREENQASPPWERVNTNLTNQL